jgi:hypothetical protein
MIGAMSIRYAKAKFRAKSKTLAKSWHLGFVVGFALITPAAFADEIAPADAKAVVERQIHAFERGDDNGAWDLAAPAIREKFSSAAAFSEMVRERYGPIYNHRSVEFGPAARRGDDVGMVVTLVANDNEVWSAIFVVTRQGDGGWRTSSCLLAKAPQTSL